MDIAGVARMEPIAEMDPLCWLHQASALKIVWTPELDVASCRAATEGNIQVLRYLKHAVDIPRCGPRHFFGTRHCIAAAESGQTSTLAWLHAEVAACHWTPAIAAAAANGRHFKTLQWMQSAGCPFDDSAMISAAKQGDLDMLKLLRSSDPPCPWSPAVCNEAMTNGVTHPDCIWWLRSRQPPCP